MYLALVDEQLDCDTFTKPIILSMKELSLAELDKVLVEMCIGDYEEFISEHCATPNTPEEHLQEWYPGTFGDKKHLNYKFDNDVSIGDIISGKATMLTADDDSGDRNAPWARRLRFMSATDYEAQLNEEFTARLNALSAVVNAPEDHTVEKFVERRNAEIFNMFN